MASGRLRRCTIAAALAALLASPVAAEVVVVVAQDSPIEALTTQQLADIYLGRRDHLVSGQAVEPIDQTEHSQAYSGFYTEYLDRTPAQIKAYWSKLVFTGRGRPPRAARGGRTVADWVARNPRAVGYLDRALVDRRLRVVAVEPR